jgi:hypothetical protein
MSNPNKYAVNEPFNERATTGSANANDWMASMEGMTLTYFNGVTTHESNPSTNPLDHIIKGPSKGAA